MTDPGPKPSEEECRQRALKHKYPNGFQCERCGHTSSYAVKRRPLVKCGACERRSKDLNIPFRCAQCENTTAIEVSKPELIECTSCGKQTSITAGTFFHGFKLSLSKIFYMIQSLENGVCNSVVWWAKELDIAPRTAWRWLQKIATVIAESFPQYNGNKVHHAD